jgi:hypothetical protein
MRKAAFATVILLLAGLAMAQTRHITTTYASNNGGSTNWVNMFDITVLNPGGIRITDLDVNISSAVNTAFTITVYITPNTYVGKDGNPSAWTKVSDGKGVGKGRDNPSPVDVSDFTLAPGTYGMGIHYVGASMAYTNGTGQNQKYQNADVALQLGLVRAGFFTGTVFQPRVWNGTIYYVDTAVLTGSGTGKPGTSIDFTLTAVTDAGLPYQLGSALGNGPIPIDTRVLGLSVDNLLVLSTGGMLPSVFQDYVGFLDKSGAAKAKLNIPNFPGLTGMRIYTAFLTMKGSAPSNVANISNTFLFSIQ